MPPFIQRADERIYARLSRSETPFLDATLPRLSRAANHSRLWIGISAILAVAGGRRGRAAAARGLISIGVASALVNGPLKLLARRHRPQVTDIPLIRRLPRFPLTSSFPSGHATSAAAFATAASLEMPAVAPPVGILAAGVAVSRVYTGAHYPSDVVVGAAIGAGAGLVTHRVANARAKHAPAATALPQQGTVDTRDGRGLVVALNPNADSDRDAIVDRLLDAFPNATIVKPTDSPADEVRARCGPETTAIVAAGGDGTINALAAVAMEYGVPLGVLPYGTMNHLARDLGIDDAGAGIEAIRKGRLAQIDVATIAERPFLNTGSIGAYPDFVDARESLEDKIGKWPAASASLLRMLRHNSPAHVEIDGREMTIWALFIGNGAYAPEGFVPIRRTSLDDGALDVRVLRAERSFAPLRLPFAQGIGRMKHASFFEAWTADRIHVRSLDGPLRLARDGETFDGPERFTIEKSPKQLQVFVPDFDR